MSSVTISTRLESEEVGLLDDLVRSTGLDRSALTRSLLRKGMKELQLKEAVLAYRREKISLSRAAQNADIGIWDFLALMKTENLEIHYDVEDFESDLQTLSNKV